MKLCALLAAAVPVCAAFAAGPVKPRIARPPAFAESADQIVYSINAVEWGADATGGADSSAAIQKALDALRDGEGGTLYLPAGRYRLEKTLVVEGGVSLVGDWARPEPGIAAKGTVLAVSFGKGSEDVARSPAVRVKSGACLKGVAIWHPDQDCRAPSPYPASICGEGHSCVEEVTLVNSWFGFYNNNCSSMLVRELYGTCLSRGIHGAYAYDIPRIEHVRLDTRFWAESGLPGAPKGRALARLERYAEENLVGIVAGEQDWGYWWDVEVRHAKTGISLEAVPSDDGKKMVPGNIAAGKVVMSDVGTGLYLENVGYPGFQLTHSDIAASHAGIDFAPRPDAKYARYEADGVRPAYYRNSSLVVTDSTFRGGRTCVISRKRGRYALNFGNCVFSGARLCALAQQEGTLVLSNCRFNGKAPCLGLAKGVEQAVLTGNEWGGAKTFMGAGPDKEIVFRDDDAKAVARTPRFDFSGLRPARSAEPFLFDVTDYGAVAGTARNPPAADSTPAFRKALAAAAEKGGVVYAPGGTYRMEGSLRVPGNVVLRGTFNGQHYGNSTHRGAQLFVYGGRDAPDGAAFITLEPGAVLRGFSVFYPEQGMDESAADEAMRIKKYPATVRAARDCRIEDMSIVGAWRAIDAMGERCDNLAVSDVTGGAIDSCLELGHGARGGIVRDFHFNFSGWTHQGAYYSEAMRKTKDPFKPLLALTARKTRGLVLGDAKSFKFFSCFNILVAEQIVLEKDPHTGGDFAGVMWGVAFDAAGHGVVGRSGCAGKLAIIASMGVFNQNGGGYYVRTDPGFRGLVGLFNADVWSGYSRLAEIAGGRAVFGQLFSWCCGNGVARAGGDLCVHGSVMVSNNGDNDRGDMVDFAFEDGAKGSVAGSADCRKMLHVTGGGSAGVRLVNNGFMRAER